MEGRTGLGGTRRSRRPPGENRERLLSAGAIEFGLHGYHGASTAAIAAAAEVPQPHVYANFSSKQQLFLACVDRMQQQFADGQHPTEVHARLLLQAIAAAHDASLQHELHPALVSMRDRLGDRLHELLRQAADSLIAHDTPRR